MKEIISDILTNAIGVMLGILFWGIVSTIGSEVSHIVSRLKISKMTIFEPNNVIRGRVWIKTKDGKRFKKIL